MKVNMPTSDEIPAPIALEQVIREIRDERYRDEQHPRGWWSRDEAVKADVMDLREAMQQGGVERFGVAWLMETLNRDSVQPKTAGFSRPDVFLNPVLDLGAYMLALETAKEALDKNGNSVQIVPYRETRLGTSQVPHREIIFIVPHEFVEKEKQAISEGLARCRA